MLALKADSRGEVCTYQLPATSCFSQVTPVSTPTVFDTVATPTFSLDTLPPFFLTNQLDKVAGCLA
jgi:hypothetical protein